MVLGLLSGFFPSRKMNIQIPYFPCAMATLNLIEAVEKLILTWSHGYVCHSFAVVLCG